MKQPIYLSGAIRQELAGRPEFGYMSTPNMGNKLPANSQWFADNGCFSSKGERAFDLDKYLGWLRKRDASSCLGATAPDKVGNAHETAKRSLPVLPLIRECGYRASFVAQDGLYLTQRGHLLAISTEGAVIAVPWDAFDVLFIGGSTEWKLSTAAVAIIKEAKSRGKWVHMGRVNSWKRYSFAMLAGCDSVDGTFLAFAPSQNLPKLESWILRGKQACQISTGGGHNENSISMRRDKCTIGLTSEGLAARDSRAL